MNQLQDLGKNVQLATEYYGEIFVALLGVPIDTTVIIEYEQKDSPVYNFKFSKMIGKSIFILTGCSFSKGFYTYRRMDNVRYYENVRFISPYLGFEVILLERRTFWLKSTLSVAITFSKREGDNPKVFENGKSNSVGLHADFIKMEFGNRIRGMLSLGYGVSGLFRCGLNYNF